MQNGVFVNAWGCRANVQASAALQALRPAPAPANRFTQASPAPPVNTARPNPPPPTLRPQPPRQVAAPPPRPVIPVQQQQRPVSPARAAVAGGYGMGSGLGLGLNPTSAGFGIGYDVFGGCHNPPPFWLPGSVPREGTQPPGYTGWLETDTVVSGWTDFQHSMASATAWLIDANAQKSPTGGALIVKNGSKTCPVYAGTEPSGAPVYAVAPQTQRQIDLGIYRGKGDNRPTQVPVKLWFWVANGVPL
jgi:hypothetical protein